MLNRTIPLVVCISAVAGLSLAQSNQGTGYVIETANPASSQAGQFQGFVYNANSIGAPTFSQTGPAGASQIIADPAGKQFWVLGAGGLQTWDPSFTTSKTINGIGGTPTQGVMSPDGRRLLIAAAEGSGASEVFVLDTSSNTVIYSQNITGCIPGGIAACPNGVSTGAIGAYGMVVSRDSSTAYILAESGDVTLTVLNLIPSTPVEEGSAPIILRNPVTGDTLGGGARSFSMSPLGLMYITAVNSVLELNAPGLQACINSPATCHPVDNVIAVSGIPGPPQFTPDGTAAYMVNLDVADGGPSLYKLTLPADTITVWPAPQSSASGQEQFDSFVVAGNSRMFAHSSNDTTLWDVAADFSGVLPTALSSTGAPITSVLAILGSNELPSAHYLYAMVSGGGNIATLYRFDLVSNTVTSQAALSLGPGPMQFVYIPEGAGQACSPSPSTPCYTFLTYDTTQTVAAGQVGLPLIARVLDPSGRPVYGVQVAFSASDPSLTISKASTVTNEDGYVQATVTAGQTGGNFSVTLTAGTAGTATPVTFSVVVPGANGGGGGGGGGGGNANNFMTIVAGDGGLYQGGFFGPSNPPLTVLVTDSMGNPLQNVAVTFTVTGDPVVNLGNPSATTDANGLASTMIEPQFLQPLQAFDQTTISATSVQGSVVFHETVFQTNSNGTGGVGGSLVAPVSQRLTIGEGDTIMNAIQVYVEAESFGVPMALQNIGMSLVDVNNPANPAAITCTGDPLSDNNGIVNCNAIASCMVGLGTYGALPFIGGNFETSAVIVTITQGSTQLIAKQTGDVQSAPAGSALSAPLVVKVTDKCGTPVSGLTVTWKVTQGTATLSKTSTTTSATGLSQTSVTLGSTPGTVQITATIAGGTPVTFSETAKAVPGTLTLVSGNNQTANLGQSFPMALVFQLKDTSNNPIPNQKMTFTVSGPVTLGAPSGTPSGTTDSNGEVTVTVTAQGVAEAATVTATSDGLSATANLTVEKPGPSISATSFVNAASGVAGMAPCSLTTVTGDGLAPDVNGVVFGNTLGIGPLMTTLSGVSITVDGIRAPLLSVSNQGGVQQVNFQNPCEIPISPATVVVTVNENSVTVPNVSVLPAQPGIFTFTQNGFHYGWVISASNGSYLSPSNLAHVGQTYYLVATGLGETSPNTISTNAPGTGTQTIPVQNVVLAIGGNGVPVSSAEYLPGAVGEYLITFTIPTTVNGAPFPTGTNQPISLGIVSNGQTLYDTAPVVLPGIN